MGESVMQEIGLIVYPGFQALGLSMSATFELANSIVGQPIYGITLLSEDGGLVMTSAGFAVNTEPFDDRRFDTLLVLGDNVIPPITDRMVNYLRDARAITRRLGSICTGAHVLAQAGLLDGCRATTHWCHSRELQQAYPSIKVEEDRIFINDGSIWTAAGMSACVDLSLALLEKDLGEETARMVSKQLVVYHRRAGGQSQFSVMQDLSPKSDRIQVVLTYARQHLNQDLSVENLAEIAHMSPRQFSRVFTAETGQSPAKAVEHLRVESARMMMEVGSHTVDSVAREVGFGDQERMRRAFLRAFGQPPQVFRRASRH
jgi:transcriptional regulator GlxA family with amidase domain